ncbi:MAG: hypothetical protein MJ126_04580 [Lachnospiraceae bacterium]|nr:hypothetical protein [Lachnospiraceae bacterium]
MKKNIIAEAVKRTYADINRINGYIKYTRNNSYGFTAKFEASNNNPENMFTIEIF